MRSMTGFGQASGENRRHRVALTLRTVNSRYLDLNLRLRDEYRSAEVPLRELLAGELERGRVEVGLEIVPLDEPEVTVTVRRGLVQALGEACGELAEQGLVEGRLTPGDLLRTPEAVVVATEPDSWDEADLELLLSVAGRALAELVEARGREGGKLATMLEERRAALTAAAGQLDQLRSGVVEEAAAALSRRLDELLGDSRVDPQRLAQEVAVLADRADVSEEIDRLRAHLEHFRELAGEPGAIGKRLDFLVQEILRELNTLGAKCRTPPVTRVLMEAKGLCEQLREQVQNVE